MTPLIDPDLTSPDHRILITGGVRSGKSRYGETLLADSAEVTYVATGPVPDPATDPEWAARIVDHRARRPAHWSTIESSDVASVLGSVSGAIMIDCLGTWLTAVIDRLGTWEEPLASWQERFSRSAGETDQVVAGPSRPGGRRDQRGRLGTGVDVPIWQGVYRAAGSRQPGDGRRKR